MRVHSHVVTVPCVGDFQLAAVNEVMQSDPRQHLMICLSGESVTDGPNDCGNDTDASRIEAASERDRDLEFPNEFDKHGGTTALPNHVPVVMA
jgi:hypothetical protein